MKTKEKLAQALMDVGAPDEMVAKARRGYYDDFQSELAFPILQLVQDCKHYGLSNIASRAKNGEFDATPEESEEWFKSEEDQAAFNEFQKHQKGGTNE